MAIKPFWFAPFLCHKRNLPNPSTRLLQVQRLAVAIALQPTDTPLGANTRLLVSAERHPRVQLEVRVDPDIAGLELMGDLVGAVEIAGPDGGTETV